jgi:hypothetical protein
VATGDERVLGRVDTSGVTTLLSTDLDEEAGALRVVGRTTDSSDGLLAAVVPLDGSPAEWRRLVPRSYGNAVAPLGWFEDGWALVLVRRGQQPAVPVFEVGGRRDGARIEVERGFTGGVPQLAADLADGPYQDGTPEPDAPADPRLLAGGGVALAVLAALAAGTWWRRRRLLG